MPIRVVVVGASLAGARVIKALRRKGFDGQIALIGEEAQLPYDRPPLSKQFLTSVKPLGLKFLEQQAFYDDIELRIGSRAVGLRRLERCVELDNGSTVCGDHIVIATGARPRTLPGLPAEEQTAYLRTVGDAERIRLWLHSGAGHLLIVGAGFIGCEVAAAARKCGLEVTLVDQERFPVRRGVGEQVGEAIADLHRDNGVTMRLGVSVQTVESGGERKVVTLSDGARFDADFVVVGIGAVADTDWLVGAGLRVGDGLLCDHGCRAIGGDGRIWAVGDVASWPSLRMGGTQRLEHWSNAVEQAAVVAANIADQKATARHDPIPYIWSDQYGHKFQMLGAVGEGDATLLRGALSDRRFALAFSRAGRLRGVITCDLPDEIANLRNLVATSAPMKDVA